ncbi:MAG: MFS transporter [Blastocatellia bacterium]
MNHFQDNTVSTITRRLLPFLMLLYLIAYIDRSNISVAALQMNAELGLTAQMYGIGAGLFYLTYIIFEVPSNVILARVGARRWIARIMVSWGIVACGMAFIQNAGQLYTMRLLLGAAEAGFTPGIIFYLSRWFPATRRARAMSFFYMAATMASVIGLPLSGALLKMNGIGGFSGWRWLYFVEGVPAILLGVVVLRVLPDGPAEAKWLTSAQQEWLVTTIAAESANAPASHGHGWHRAFSDRRVWALGLFWLLQAFGTIGITVFLPQILKGLSSASNFVVTLYSALPFIFASLVMYVNGHHSDRTRERRFHLAVPMIAAGILLAVSLRAGSLPLTYLLLILTIGLNWAATPVFWSVTTEYLAGSAAAASAIALINSIANIAGVGLPPVMGAIRDHTGRYDGGLLLVAAALFLGGLLALWLVGQTRGETGEQDTGVKIS